MRQLRRAGEPAFYSPANSLARQNRVHDAMTGRMMRSLYARLKVSHRP